MVPSLTTILVIFLVGFALHRHRTVLIGIAAALVLGALLAKNPVMDWAVHTLNGVIHSIT
jgi:hypothetical protein